MTIRSEPAKGADANAHTETTDSGANADGEETHHEAHRVLGVFPRLHRRSNKKDNPGLFRYAKDYLKKIGASDAHWRPRHQPLVRKGSSPEEGDVDDAPEQTKRTGPISRAA